MERCPSLNSAWKKTVPILITICLEVFEFEALILPCTGVGRREDVLRFNRHEFCRKGLNIDPALDCRGIANLDCVTFVRHLLYAYNCSKQIELLCAELFQFCPYYFFVWVPNRAAIF